MWAMGEELDGGVRPAELIAAISLATDIGMAQPLETGLAVWLGAGLTRRVRPARPGAPRRRS
jgi:hypothetical protein